MNSPHNDQTAITKLKERIGGFPRVTFAQLPTPLHRLDNFSRLLDIDLWIKRDDLTGFEGGGNKTRKLEFIVADAVEANADTLVTIGALQSNHTRQTAAAAARMGLKCALLHTGWTRDAGEFYRSAGNLLLSELMGAELFVDETPRPIEDESPLQDFAARLRAEGRDPYVIPGGASEHRLGSLGYMNCAIELVAQSQQLGRSFDYVVHCTGSGSTQAGLLAGFCALHAATKVIGIADDEETEIKTARVRNLANDTLRMLGLAERVAQHEVSVLSVDQSTYGQADPQTLKCIRDFASNEGLIADPVYEGKAIRGLVDLARRGFFPKDARVLLMHLGGSPAIHAYANKFGEPKLENITRADG